MIDEKEKFFRNFKATDAANIVGWLTLVVGIILALATEIGTRTMFGVLGGAIAVEIIGLAFASIGLARSAMAMFIAAAPVKNFSLAFLLTRLAMWLSS